MYIRIVRFGTVFAAAILNLSLAQEMPKTTKETLKGTPTVTTEQLHGTVVYVEGNDLVVRMSNGDIREFKVPPSRRFIIDGKDMSASQLTPGTELTATVTTRKTPVTERTRTVGTGKVWWVSGNTVILTLPNNENRTYKVQESYRFVVDGKPASVHDLRRGMTISAEKIVEEPVTEIASDVAVTGKAPAPPQRPAAPERAAAPPPPPAPIAEPAPAPPPAPAAQAAPPAPEPSSPQPSLPATASPLPLIGLAGVLLVSTYLLLRFSRRVWK
jgi:hypothetical protein